MGYLRCLLVFLALGFASRPTLLAQTSSDEREIRQHEGKRIVFIDTYVRQDGHWRCVASQSTLTTGPQ
jgi:hypothetical protein